MQCNIKVSAQMPRMQLQAGLSVGAPDPLKCEPVLTTSSLAARYACAACTSPAYANTDRPLPSFATNHKTWRARKLLISVHNSYWQLPLLCTGYAPGLKTEHTLGILACVK